MTVVLSGNDLNKIHHAIALPKNAFQIDTSYIHCYYLFMLQDASFDVIKRGLSYSVKRHEMIADNIANVSTANYRRKDVEFKTMMQENMDNAPPAWLTNAKHMPLNTERQDMAMNIIYPQETDTKTDNNNVDLDKEVVNMSNNTGYFNTLATIYSKKSRMLKEAISERIA